MYFVFLKVYFKSYQILMTILVMTELMIIFQQNQQQYDIKYKMKPKGRKVVLNKYKDEKKKICESFEKRFEQNVQFDAYIETQFRKMMQQKSENPTLIIPQGFKKFLQSKSFKQLLKKIYQYMEALIQYEQKYDSIRKQQGDKINSDPLFRPLRYETSILQKKCKEISYAYMGILLGFGDNKMVFKDQYFFETMIYFLTQLLRGNFDPAQYTMVEEQLNRIFRTQSFNLAKRRHLQDQQLNKYPAIKQSKYDGSVFSLMKLQSRLSLQKKNNYSMQIREERSSKLTKPFELSLSTFHSIRRRSPLIASFYPSQKQKLFQFSKEVREKQSFVKTNSARRNSLALDKLQLKNQIKNKM